MRLPLAHRQVIRVPYARYHGTDLQQSGGIELRSNFIFDGGVGVTAFNPGTCLGVGFHRTQLNGRVVATDRRFQCMPGRQHQHPFRQFFQRLHLRRPDSSDKYPTGTTKRMTEIQ
ncbi:hypothetical protein D3C80_1417790 [compost metagenome]